MGNGFTDMQSLMNKGPGAPQFSGAGLTPQQQQMMMEFMKQQTQGGSTFNNQPPQQTPQGNNFG
jgi:hypothetical protein